MPEPTVIVRMKEDGATGPSRPCARLFALRRFSLTFRGERYLFTGIIEGVGRLAARESIGGDVRFTFHVGNLPFDHVQMGESIAINGVCLTVIAFDASSFQADASTETLGLTTLGQLGEGALEPILFLGEHYVSDFIEPGASDGTKAPLELVLCRRCRLLQLKHTVPGDAMYRNYWYLSGTNQTMRTALADIAYKAEQLAHLNPTAHVRAAAFGEVAPDWLFDGAVRDPRDLELGRDHGRREHDHDVRSCVLFQEEVDWTGFGLWLTMLLQARGPDILRVKGFLNVGGDGPVLVSCVQHAVHPPLHLDEWPDEDRRSRLVFIGRGVTAEELEASLRAFDRAARG